MHTMQPVFILKEETEVYDIVLTLPEQVIASVLTEWLEIADVAQLDSAMCNRSIRPLYLNTAYSPCVTYDTTPRFQYFHCFRERSSPEDVTSWALLRGAGLRELNISRYFSESAEKRQKYLQKYGPMVRKVSLRHRSIESFGSWWPTLNDICAFCPNVTELECGDKFTECAYNLIGLTWPDLEAITMGDAATPDCFYAIGRACKKLKHFHGGECENWDNLSGWVEFLQLAGSTLECIGGRCKKLLFNDEVLQAIAQFCPNLTVYGADSCGLRGQRLATIVNGCPKLTAINLEHAIFNDADLAVLQPVVCRKAITWGVAVRMADCYGVSDENMYNFLWNCQNLQSLHLTYAVEKQFSEEVLMVIGQRCHMLEDLDVHGQIFFTDAEMLSIAHGCTLLRRLDISHTSATDDGLIAVLIGCPALVSLYMVGCSDISDRSLVHVPKHCPRMEELCVIGCMVTMHGLATIAWDCRRLRYIAVPYRLLDIASGWSGGNGLAMKAIFGRKVFVDWRTPPYGHKEDGCDWSLY